MITSGTRPVIFYLKAAKSPKGGTRNRFVDGVYVRFVRVKEKGNSSVCAVVAEDYSSCSNYSTSSCNSRMRVAT